MSACFGRTGTDQLHHPGVEPNYATNQKASWRFFLRGVDVDFGDLWALRALSDAVFHRPFQPQTRDTAKS